MREISLWDLSNIAEIKSDILNVILLLELFNGCAKEEAANDLRKAVVKLIELEDSMQETFSSETPSKTKNRLNADTLAGSRKAIINS